MTECKIEIPMTRQMIWSEQVTFVFSELLTEKTIAAAFKATLEKITSYLRLKSPLWRRVCLITPSQSLGRRDVVATASDCVATASKRRCDGAYSYAFNKQCCMNSITLPHYTKNIPKVCRSAENNKSHRFWQTAIIAVYFLMRWENIIDMLYGEYMAQCVRHSCRWKE